MTNTATDQTAIDALADGDVTFVDDLSASSATKKMTALQIDTYIGAVKPDVTNTISVGYAATVYDAGTKSSGTYTPDEANGGMQKAVNGGAHTLAPPTNSGTINIQYTNNASAGTITTSGFTKVTGDTISTTDGDDFFFWITKSGTFSHLHVQALQ